MRLHAPLLTLSICLIVGIAASEWLDNWTTALFALLPATLITILLYRFPRIQTASIGICVILLGATLGARQYQQLNIEWPEKSMASEVIVISEPVIKEKVVTADLLTSQGHYKIKGHFLKDSASQEIQLGEGICLYSNINKVHAWKSGHFDYQRHMKCHGYVGETVIGHGKWHRRQISLSGLSIIERSRLHFLLLRHKLLEHYRKWDTSEETYGILAAMTLGEKSKLDTQLKETYSQVGASHILALSGLHLMIIYTIVSLFMGWIRFRICSQVLITLSIWAFAFLTGLSPSVVRSASMITVYAILSIGYRNRMSVNTLAFVAIIMMVVNPYAIYDMGFQLSFLSVLAILLFTPLFNNFIPAHFLQRHRWLKTLWNLTNVSLAAQIGTAPLVTYYFGRFATWFLLSNYIVIPLATIILYLTLASVILYWWTAAQTILVTILTTIVSTMNSLLSEIAKLPLASLDGIQLSPFGLAMLYIIIVCFYIVLSVSRPRQYISKRS